MGGGTVLQMDYATPENKIVLGNNGKCCAHTDIRCDNDLLSCSNNCPGAQNRPSDLRNITGTGHITTRQNTYNELLKKSDYKNVKERIVKQLSLNLF